MSETLSPTVNEDTTAVVEGAVESLGALRGFPCIDDPGVQLHLLASLSQEIHVALTMAVFACREHNYGWDEVAELLGTTSHRARTHYHDSDPHDPHSP